MYYLLLNEFLFLGSLINDIILEISNFIFLYLMVISLFVPLGIYILLQIVEKCPMERKKIREEGFVIHQNKITEKSYLWISIFWIIKPFTRILGIIMFFKLLDLHDSFYN